MPSPAVAHPCCLPRALYTYEDGSDDLKLAASGGKVLCPCSRLGSASAFPSTRPGAGGTWADGAVPGGGLLELSGHFEIQKVMYGFCSVKDPQAVLPKYVLVNWVSVCGGVPTEAAVWAGAWLGAREEPVMAGAVRGCSMVPLLRGGQWHGGHLATPPRLLQVGEDVPDARKCACASHVAKIAEFFQVGDAGEGDDATGAPTLVPDGRSPPAQGVDVIVNASSVEDIDPGAIGQRLSNGLARVSSPVLHRLRLREDENAEPVVMSLWR